MPRLRFPEFRDAGKWEVKRLDRTCEINPQSSELPNVFIYIDLESVIDGQLIQRKEITREHAPIRAQRLLKNGDIIYQTVRPYQKNNYYCEFKDEHKYVASTGYAQLRPFENSKFLYHLLHTDNFVAKVLSKCAGANYPAINSSDLASTDVLIPFLPEQQKIADCLSSLDEAIELEAQKLEALKTHKKGLMQQLFPREGETTPRLHFPEFRNAGEWIRTPVSEFGKVVTGKTPSTFKQEYWNGQFTWVTPTDISDRKNIYSSERRLTDEGITAGVFLPENSVLVTCIASIGKNAILKVPGSCNQQINAIIPNKEFVADFLYYLIENNSDILLDQAGTSATSIIPNSQFQKLSFLVPSLPEQHKIADCLSSLDEVIEFQAQKLEALKTHKKGLMQQLFPQEVD